MKKTLKLFAIAMMACTFFAACGDDEEEIVFNDGILVKFGDAQWLAKDILGDDMSASYKVVQLAAFKDYDSETAPWCQGTIPSKVANVVYNHDQNSYFFWYYENDNDFTVYNGNSYCNWQPNTFEEKITAIDLTARTVSSSCTGSLYYLPEYMETEGVSPDEVLNKNIEITMKDAQWEAVTKGRTFKSTANLVK